MRKLLLVSSSRVHGSGYLGHCERQLRELFANAKRVLFVPLALGDRDAYAATARRRFEEMGFGLDSVHDAENPRRAVEDAEGVFIGGGNTFRLLHDLYALDLVEPLRSRALSGMPYMGTSAGSNVACATIKTTNDMPIIYPPSFEALGLVPFNINPHYLDPDPTSTHKGETRETRIREFHELNKPPVVGLREGSMLKVDGSRALLLGAVGGRLFQQGEEARELSDGEDLSSLLA